jgi:6,7-dimethyl-8-ribityllumazine synthase
MSHAIPNRPQTSLERSHVAIVASRYNEAYVDAMLDAARDEIQTVAPNMSIAVYRVPGAFEVPVTVETVIRSTEVQAVIALGLIIRGETEHGNLVADSVTTALQNIAVTHGIPVVHEVLLVDNEQQARARCMEEKINRGTEAARVAINMVSLFHKIKAATKA